MAGVRQERGFGVIQEPRRNAPPVLSESAAVSGCFPAHKSPDALPLLKTGEPTGTQPPPRGCKECLTQAPPGKTAEAEHPGRLIRDRESIDDAAVGGDGLAR